MSMIAPNTSALRQRQQPLRDRAHLDSLRDMPCLICGKTPSEPAHVRFGGDGGTGKKPSDAAAIPLCYFHHQSQHSLGESAFWEDWIGVMNMTRQGRAFIMQRIARSFYADKR